MFSCSLPWTQKSPFRQFCDSFDNVTGFSIYTRIYVCACLFPFWFFELINNKKLSHSSLVTAPPPFSTKNQAQISRPSELPDQHNLQVKCGFYIYVYICVFLFYYTRKKENINNRKSCVVPRCCVANKADFPLSSHKPAGWHNSPPTI